MQVQRVGVGMDLRNWFVSEEKKVGNAYLVDEHPKCIHIAWLSQRSAPETLGWHKAARTSDRCLPRVQGRTHNVILDCGNPKIAKDSILGTVNEYVELGTTFRG
jgi:hypothetical protein